VRVKEGRLSTGTPILEELTAPQVGCLVQQLDLVNEVVRLFFEVDAVHVHAAGIDLLVRREGRGLGDDVDFDPLSHQLVRQFVYVWADASDNTGRVFPRQHHHPEHEALWHGFGIRANVE